MSESSQTVHESSPLTWAQMLTSFRNVYMVTPEWGALAESQQEKAVVMLEGEKTGHVIGHVPLSPCKKQEECQAQTQRGFRTRDTLQSALGTQYYTQYVRLPCKDVCAGSVLLPGEYLLELYEKEANIPDAESGNDSSHMLTAREQKAERKLIQRFEDGKLDIKILDIRPYRWLCVRP